MERRIEGMKYFFTQTKGTKIMATRREKEKQKARRTSAAEWADKQEAGFDPTGIKLPEGVKFFQIKRAGTYRLDFIPYNVGEGNPQADPGFQHPERTYYAHWVPGMDGKSKLYVCSASTFKKRCAVCDWVMRNRDADPKLLEQLKIKLRQLWNVIDLDDPKKEIQVYDAPYWKSFGEMFKDAIRVHKKYNCVFEPEEGMTVQLTTKDNKSGFGKFAIARVDIVPRDEQYDESIIDKAVVLDDCLIEPNYKELMALLEGTGDEEEATTNGKARGKAQDPDEDDDEDDDEESPQTKGKKKAKAEEEEEDNEEDEDPEMEDEDDEEEEKPAAKKKPHANGKKEKTAKELGLKVGMEVEYDGMECEILKVSGDGTSLTLEDENGKKHMGVNPNEVEAGLVDEEDEEDEKPAKKSSKKAAPKDEDDDDEDDSDDDDDGDEEDSEMEDDEDDEESLEDDEDDDEEEAPRKKAGKKR